MGITNGATTMTTNGDAMTSDMALEEAVGIQLAAEERLASAQGWVKVADALITDPGRQDAEAPEWDADYRARALAELAAAQAAYEAAGDIEFREDLGWDEL